MGQLQPWTHMVGLLWGSALLRGQPRAQPPSPSNQGDTEDREGGSSGDTYLLAATALAGEKSPFCPLYLASAAVLLYGAAFPAASMDVRLPCALVGLFLWAEPRRRAPSPAGEL